MPALKRILGSLFAIAAVLAGIVVAVAAAVAAFIFFIARKPGLHTAAAGRRMPAGDRDIIDISATEVGSRPERILR